MTVERLYRNKIKLRRLLLGEDTVTIDLRKPEDLERKAAAARKRLKEEIEKVLQLQKIVEVVVGEELEGLQNEFNLSLKEPVLAAKEGWGEVYRLSTLKSRPLATLLMPSARSHDSLEFRIAKVAAGKSVYAYKNPEIPVLAVAVASQELKGAAAHALSELLKQLGVEDYLVRGVVLTCFGVEL